MNSTHQNFCNTDPKTFSRVETLDGVVVAVEAADVWDEWYQASNATRQPGFLVTQSETDFTVWANGDAKVFRLA